VLNLFYNAVYGVQRISVDHTITQIEVNVKLQ